MKKDQNNEELIYKLRREIDSMELKSDESNDSWGGHGLLFKEIERR